ncbi:hypothetical protein [Lichenicola sp.]|uniref:phosphorylase family protein n=1 Tax=Lichenicola sp. TaxID=2804529 RepID=UPI003B00B83E
MPVGEASALARDPGLGIVVGLRAEAKLARTLFPAAMIGISGATPDGARRAVSGLLAQGATRLLSFGLAAGLDPDLRAGDVLLPDAVVVDGARLPTDPGLRALLAAGRTIAPPSPRTLPSLDLLLHSDMLVTEVATKALLLARSGCRSLDMESGPVALAATRAGIPFAALRAICDPADRTLPPAACIALRPDGRLKALQVLGSILRRPGQLPTLLALGRDASRAKWALLDVSLGSPPR